jgi:hypothetical protein
MPELFHSNFYSALANLFRGPLKSHSRQVEPLTISSYRLATTSVRRVLEPLQESFEKFALFSEFS